MDRQTERWTNTNLQDPPATAGDPKIVLESHMKHDLEKGEKNILNLVK